MAGARQKRPDRLQGHREVAPLRVVTAPPLEGDVVSEAPARTVPAPPLAMDGSALRADSAELWSQFWQSASSTAVNKLSDLGRLNRWVQAVNERTIVSEVVAKARLIPGSMGQARLNPLVHYLVTLRAEIEAAEQHFGMTPLSRFRLGIEAAEAALTADDLNRALDRAAKGPD